MGAFEDGVKAIRKNPRKVRAEIDAAIRAEGGDTTSPQAQAMWEYIAQLFGFPELAEPPGQEKG